MKGSNAVPLVQVREPQVTADVAAGVGVGFDPQVGIDTKVVVELAVGSGDAAGVQAAPQLMVLALRAFGAGLASGALFEGKVQPNSGQAFGSVFGAAIATGLQVAAPRAIGSAAGFPVTKGASAPADPVLSGVPGDNVASLSWTTPANNGATITGYGVLRDLAGLITLGNVNSYNDTTAKNGTSYIFTVLAINSQGPGQPSNSVPVKPVAGSSVPAAPVLAGTSGPAVANLSWSGAAAGESVTGYKVYRDGVFVPPQLGVQLSYQATGLTNGVSYSFRVSAVNLVGEGALSNAVAVIPSASGVPNPPADITNGLGAWRAIAWGGYPDMAFENHALWATRGYGGYKAGMQKPGSIFNSPGAGPDFKASSALPAPAPAPYVVQSYIEANFDPGAAGCEGYLGTHAPHSSHPFDWASDTERAAFATWWANLAGFIGWYGHGIVGISSDTEQGVFTYATNATTLARVVSWWYEAAKAVFQRNPNCKFLVYDWHPKGGAAWDGVYTQQGDTVPFTELWTKHYMVGRVLAGYGRLRRAERAAYQHRRVLLQDRELDLVQVRDAGQHRRAVPLTDGRRGQRLHPDAMELPLRQGRFLVLQLGGHRHVSCTPRYREQ